MRGVFDFFQKSKRDSSKKLKPVSEPKSRLLPEARFRCVIGTIIHCMCMCNIFYSSDEKGRKISMAWEKYIARLLVATDGSSAPSEVSWKQDFQVFIGEFISEYEYVINTQRYEPLFYCEDERPPGSIEGTWGHPTEVVLHISKLLLEYIQVDDGENDHGRAQEWLAAARPMDPDKLLLSDSLHVVLRKLFIEEGEAPSHLTERRAARAHFLCTVHALTVISFWPHNRNVMVEHLGRNYPRLLIQMVRSFVSKLEEAIVWHIESGKKEDVANQEASGEEATQQEDTTFILYALLSMVQLLAQSSPALLRTAQTRIDYGDSLPPQPWSRRDRGQFGYSDILQYFTQVNSPSPGAGGGLSGAPSAQSPGARTAVSSPVDCTPSPPDSRTHRPRTSTAAYYLSHENVSQLSSEESQDAWSAMVMQGGVIRALISLLNKLAYLSRALASPHLYASASRCAERSASESSASRAEDGAMDPMRSSPESTAGVSWSACAALQCECLLALLAYASSHPIAMQSRFNVCNGAGVVCSLLSMQDTPPYTALRAEDFHIGFHRGMLSLKLVEQMVSSMSTDLGGTDSFEKDLLMSLDNLQLFMAWMQTYFVAQNSLGIEGFDLQRLRDMTLTCSEQSAISAPAPSSDLWPWTEVPAFMLSGGRGGRIATSFDGSVPETDFDLCDWGPVVPQYTDSGTFLQKYVKSMRMSQEYSLQNAAADVFEGCLCSPEAPMPWFARGLASTMWNRLFASLFAICVATQGKDMSEGDVEEHGAARLKLLSSVMANIMTSLHVCAEAQSVLTYTSMVDGSESSSVERDAGTSHSSASHLPVFQVHMIMFIGMLLQTFPSETIATCRHRKVWSLLVSSSSFLLGGREEVNALLLKGKRDVTKKRTDMETGPECTVNVWSLHSEGHNAHELTRLSTSMSLKAPAPPSTDTGNRSMLFSMDTDDLLEHCESEEEGVDYDERRLRFDSLDSTHAAMSLGAVGSETSFFDVEKTDRVEEGHVRESNDLSLGLSPPDDTFPLSSSLGETFISQQRDDLVADFNVLLESDEPWSTLSDELKLKAFAWISLFDFVFQLMQMVGEVTENQFPSTSLARAPQPDSTTELYTLLQAVGRDTPDYIVLQTMNWIRCSLARGRRVRAAAGDQYKHILFKCLSLSKYQLLSSCDTSSTPPTAESGALPFWIGEEYEDINLLRPFLWPARCAVLSVIMDIMMASPGRSWFKAYLPKSPENSSGSRVALKDNVATPKHVTLLLLILDPKCRSVALHLLMEVLHVATCLCHAIPTDLRRNARSTDYSSDRNVGPLTEASLKSQNSKLDVENSSKSVQHAIFHDIIKCLFVSHVKYAMLQPQWCQGAEIVASIYQWFKSFLGSADRAPYLPYYQEMLILYGHAGPHHFALNWAKARPHIFRELFLSADECTKRSGTDASLLKSKEWSTETRLSTLRHFLAMLTAVMLRSDIMKHRFTSLMLLKKYSKNKAKVTSSPTGEGGLWSNPYSTCNFHDVAGMIKSLEPSPSLETILILFDMLLDGPCEDNAQLIASNMLPPTGLFFNEENKVCLSNMVVIPIILLLVPSCSLPLQKCIFQSLHNLLVGRFALVNLSKCGDAQPPVFDSLLDLFLHLPEETQPLCVDLMQVIGRHNVSVAQLKRMFRLMHTKGDFRPKCTWMLLKTLRLMINEVKRPKHFFLFEGGAESGLRIPTIYRWPAPGGYSVCFWFCVRNPTHLRQDTASDVGSPVNSSSRSLVSNDDSLSYRPTLLSIRQNCGIGFEIFLEANSTSSNRTYTLVLQTHRDESENSPASRVEISFVMDESLRQKPIMGGEWYFLAVSHTAGKFRTRSEVSVLINTFYSRHMLSYPRFLGEIEEPMIGCSTPALASVDCTSTLRGQIGSIYMFSDALSEAQLRKLHDIGMDISRDLDNSLIARRALTEGSTHHPLNLDSILSSVMLAYNPGVWDGNFFLDMTPEKNAVKWGKEARAARASYESGMSLQGQNRIPSKFAGKMHAYMLPGTYRCTSRDMRDALDCLGGKRVLIPLFAQFDLPCRNPDGSPNYDADFKLCNEVMSLFFALSRDNGSSPNAMAHSGFQLISYFLERISPEYLTSDLLQVFVDNSQSMSHNKEWYYSVVKFVLLNFKLWMFASYDTQNRLFTHLLKLCQNNPKDMRHLLTVRELIDALYTVYAHPASSPLSAPPGIVGVGIQADVDTIAFPVDEEEFDDTESVASAFSAPRAASYIVRQGSFYATSTYVHEATGKIVAQKVSGEKLDDIRQMIFRIILILLEGEADEDFPGVEEVQCIMYYVSHEASARAKIQAMQLLTRLLTSSSVALHKRLIAGFATGVKIHPLLALHVHPNPKVRTYAFLCLCNVIQITTVHGVLPERRQYTAKWRRKTGVSESASNIGGGQDAAAAKGSVWVEDCEATRSDCSDSSFASESDQFPSDTADSWEGGKTSVFTTPGKCGSTTTTPSGGTGGRLSPKNSFAFIPPSTSSKPPRSRFFKDRTESVSTDSFSAMGIAPSSFPYLLMWAQLNLLDMIEADVLNSHLVEQQCRVIINILTHTLIGLPSTDTVQDIEELFGSDEGANATTRFSDVSGSQIATNEHLAESVFCVAVFVPAILRFISRDIVPYTLRFSTLVSIKTQLQNFTNCDLFMQVPEWQISIFELVISEHRRMVLLRNRMCCDSSSVESQQSVVKEFDRATAILDTGIRMLCDMFLHSVEYGCPAPEIVISRPFDEVNMPLTKPTPLSMFRDVSTGKRFIGPHVLREIMSYLRCYAELGELDIDMVGISLLQQIVNALLLKRDSWKGTDNKESEQHVHIRLRNFNVCCWLAASFILEFVTSPVVQKHHDIDLMFDTPVRKPTSGHDDSRPARRGSLNMDSGEVGSGKRRRSAPNHRPPYLHRAYSSPPTTTPATRHHDDPVTPEVSSKMPFGRAESSDCVSEISDDIFGRSELSPQSGSGDMSASDVFSPTLSSTLSPPMAPVTQRSSSVETSKLDSDYDATESDHSLWKLLDSVMALLESLNPDVHKKGRVGIKIALSVGIRATREVMEIMQDTVVGAIPCSQGDEPIEQTFSGRAIPAKVISSQILWRTLRVLCNIYAQHGVSRGPLVPAKQSSQLQCLQRLRRMVKSLDAHNWGSYKFEIIHAAAKIAEVLRQTVHRPTDSWIHESMVLLVELIEKGKADLVGRLEAVGFYIPAQDTIAADDAEEVDDRQSFSLPTSRQASVSDALLDDADTKDKDRGRTSFDDELYRSIAAPLMRSRGSSNAEQRRITHEAALLAINVALKVPLSSPLTWSTWDEVMIPVLEKGVKMEDEALTSTLTDVGTHKDSQTAVRKLDNLRAKEEAHYAALSKKSEVFSKKAAEHEMISLQRLMRSLDAMKKRNARSWSQILEELANERGPWGVGADEVVEVFWSIDTTEDSQRRRMKLRRNPFGSTHAMARMFSRGRGNGDDDDDIRDGLTSQSASSSDLCSLEEKATMTGSFRTVGQGLWKDLVKYQTRAGKGPDEDGEEDNEGGEGELSPRDPSHPSAVGSGDIQHTAVASPDKKMGSAEAMMASTSTEHAGKVLFSGDCEVITPSTNSMCRPAFGTLEVTGSRITFIKKGPIAGVKPVVMTLHSQTLENHDFIWACQTHPGCQWATDDIHNILPRTFYLRPTAVEIFLTSRKTVFINLHEKAAALQLIMVIRNVVKPPHIAPFFGHRPQSIMSRITAPDSATALTQAWETREISNFDYLMHLNTIAGRSYNDLGQYPVFPWVVADYVSTELKLREPSTFRDLRWPMGAQSEHQRHDVTTRYQDVDYMYQRSLEDDMTDMGPALPPFHYGSHYSTAGFVMWYLMRLEPFTSLHVQLQEGRFDKTDRLFDSVESAWRGCTSNVSDVKELVPEFYFCPEIFENLSRLDLGKKSCGRAVGDIVLPPWASNPFDFVRLLRKALESEYVSQNLHHWIDLIFGYKQRPPYLGGDASSVTACNVFYHLTYADAVDLEELLQKDKKLHQTYVNQIAEFGQTPAQLFTSPHPQRLSIDAADIAWPIASVVLGADTIMKGDVLPDKPRKILCFRCYKISVWPVVFIAETAERLVSLDTSRVVGNHLWQSLPPDVVPPYRLKVDAAALELSHG